MNESQRIQYAEQEKIQRYILVGLGRTDFYDKAAFYGGTMLRILYGLPRFSENLDFSLKLPDSSFTLSPYFDAIQTEVEGAGYHAMFEKIKESEDRQVKSAFLKTDNLVEKIQFIRADGRETDIKIKIEIDSQPPRGAAYEIKYLHDPIASSILAYDLPSALAGKLHAALFRQWKNRVKGRDWFDIAWYARKDPGLNLEHFRQRSIQSAHCGEGDFPDFQSVKEALIQKIRSLDIVAAKNDALNFVENPDELNVWSADFFVHCAEKILRLDLHG